MSSSRWIKINEEGTSDISPGNMDDVLIYDAHSKEVIACYLWRSDDMHHFDSDGTHWCWIPHRESYRDHIKPTHWMRWPDAPEGGNDAKIS